MTVLHAEAFWDHTELPKADPLIQVSGVDIAFDYRIELKDHKAAIIKPRFFACAMQSSTSFSPIC